MRLDGLGRPTLVIAESFERAKAAPIKTEKIAEVASPKSSGPSSNGEEESRLSRILEILDTAREKKKRKNISVQIKEAVKAYQRAYLIDPVELSGQRLDIKA